MQYPRNQRAEEDKNIDSENVVQSLSIEGNTPSSENNDFFIIDFKSGYYGNSFTPRNLENVTLYPAYVHYKKPSLQDDAHNIPCVSDVTSNTQENDAEGDIETGTVNAMLANTSLGDDIV